MAVVEVLRGADAGVQYEIRPPAAVIGTSADADVRIRDDRVAHVHCRITQVGPKWSVEHIGGPSGTIVNGVAVERPRVLTNGDELCVGQTVLRFVEFATAAGVVDPSGEIETFESVLGLPESAFDVSENEFDLSDSDFHTPEPGLTFRDIPASADATTMGFQPLRDPLAHPAEPAPPPPRPRRPQSEVSGDWTGLFDDADRSIAAGLGDEPVVARPAPAMPAQSRSAPAPRAPAPRPERPAPSQRTQAPAPHTPPRHTPVSQAPVSHVPVRQASYAEAQQAEAPRTQPNSTYDDPHAGLFSMGSPAGASTARREPPTPRAPARAEPTAPAPIPVAAPAPAPAPDTEPAPIAPETHAAADESMNSVRRASAAPEPPDFDLRADEPSADLLQGLPGYEVHGPIGRGLLWSTFRGEHSESGRAVAVKAVSAQSGMGPAEVAQFIEQARQASQAAHPQLGALLEAGTHNGLLYVVTELEEGITLREHVANEPGRCLPWRAARAVAIDIARVLAVAESVGCLHLHLHPGNVVRAPDGRWRVVDLGVWGPPVAARLASEGGYPHFLAPEHARGEAVAPSADVYSLGALLYWMLSGQIPFGAEDPQHLAQRLGYGKPEPVYWTVDGMPRKLTVVIDKLMAHHPTARYASFHDVLRDLDAVPTNRDRKRSPFGGRLAGMGNMRIGMAMTALCAMVVMAGIGWYVRRTLKQVPTDPIEMLPNQPEQTEADAQAALDEFARQAAAEEAAKAAAAGADQGGQTSAEAAAADRDVAALDKERAALGALDAKTATAWLALAARYAALPVRHPPRVASVQRAAEQAREIWTQALLADLLPAELAERDWAGSVAAAIRAADELPSGMSRGMLALPTDPTTANAAALDTSLQTTLGLAQALRKERRSGHALQLLQFWINRASTLGVEGDAAVIDRARETFDRGVEASVAFTVLQLDADRAVLASNLVRTSPLPLVGEAAEKGTSRRSGAPLAFEEALLELAALRKVVSSAPYVARVAERIRRIELAQAAWTACVAALADGLVADGAELPNALGRLDLSVAPTLNSLHVRSAGSEVPRDLAWSSLRPSALASRFLVPFLAQADAAGREGALWILVELQAPDLADAALDHAGPLAPPVRRALRRELEAQWVGSALVSDMSPEELYAADHAVMLRSWRASAAGRLFSLDALRAAAAGR